MIERHLLISALIILLSTCLVYIWARFVMPDHIWFWTVSFSMGMLLIFLFAPQHRLYAGFRLLPLTEWIIMMVIPFFMIVLGPTEYELKSRILIGICFFSVEIGSGVFWHRVMVGIFWNKIRKTFGLKAKDYNR